MPGLEDSHRGWSLSAWHREPCTRAFVMVEVTLAENWKGIQGDIESCVTLERWRIMVQITKVSNGQHTKVREGYTGQKCIRVSQVLSMCVFEHPSRVGVQTNETDVRSLSHISIFNTSNV